MEVKILANNCYYHMRITGERNAIEEFAKIMSWEGPFENDGIGRVYSFEEVSPMDLYARVNGKEIATYEASGDCAWSVQTAMIDASTDRNLLGEIARLGLAVEIYSSEPGVGFQEHYVIDKGALLIDECVDYEEYWIEGAEPEYIEELCSDLGISKEELFDNLNHNGDYTKGGFGDDFANFEDLTHYIIDSLVKSYELEAFDEKFTVIPLVNMYVNNDNIYMNLYNYNDEYKIYEPFCDVTVNIDALPYLEAAIDVPNSGIGILHFLEENNIAENTGKVELSGFNIYPVYKFNEDVIRNIDESVLKSHAEAKGVFLSDKGKKAPLENLIKNAEDKNQHLHNEEPAKGIEQTR